MKKKDLLLISNLRINSRETLTNISKKIHMPISTIFDKLKSNHGGLIRKYTTLIDFSMLGFNTRAKITLKVPKKQREKLRRYLKGHLYINSLYKINNGYDFMIEAIFRNLKEMEDFIEDLEENFTIRSKQTYYIIEDIKRESFLENPEMIGMIKVPL